MLAKLGNMETEQATEKLTSTLNGYNMEVSQSVDIISKLIAVDNVAATSVNEMATALQYSSAIANQTGVTFEQLVSYTALVSETTRQSAESIGQGFKTMLARMQDIRRNKLDEDGLGINNVEISLKKADVALRDVRGNWRNFGDVLEELSGKWSTLSDTEQAYIAKSIAGVRQINTFTVLMENMDRALELQEVQFNSTGLAIERYNIYLESLEAKITTLKTTLEGIWQDAITSGLIESFVDAGVAVLKFIEDIGGIQTVLMGAGGIALIIKLFTSIKSITTALMATKYAIAGLQTGYTVMEALAVGTEMAGAAAKSSAADFMLLTAAVKSTIITVTAVIAILGALIYIVEKNTRSTKELLEELDKTNEALSKTDETIKTAKALQQEYDSLNKTMLNNVEGSDEYTSAQQRLYDVQKQLQNLIPEVNATLDAQGRTIIKTTNDITVAIDQLEDYYEAQELVKANLAESLLFQKNIGKHNDGESSLKDTLEMLGGAIQYNAISKLTPYDGKNGVYDKMLESLYTSKTSKIYMIEKAFEDLEKASAEKEFDPQGYLDTLETTKTLYAQTTDALRSVGVDGAKAWLEGASDSFKETAEFEGFKDFVENVLTEEEAEKEGQKAAENYNEGFLRGFKGMGYNDIQAENAVDYGAAGSKKLTERLLTSDVPVMTKNLNDLSSAFDAISNKELISPEQMEMFNRYGISLEFLTDGTQQLSLENGTLVNTEEALIDAMMANLRETYNMTDEQAEIARAYLEREYAANKVKEAEVALKDELSELSAMNSAIVAAQKEYANATQLSADTAYDLTNASDTLAGAAYASGDAMYYDAAAAKAALQAKVELILTEAGLSQAAAYVSQNLYDQAIAMIATGAAAQQLAGDLQPVLDALGTLANIATPGFNWSGGSGGSGGGSGKKKEDPRIKENEKLIKQLEDQIDLREDEKDALKKMQDEYNKWIEKQKESLKLAKEESDYFKEQQERTTNLANLKKEIALLELDNTEEARAKRLKLEEEAAKLEKEIAENTEDRQYDLQMQALDNLKQAYDEMIEKQIEAIDMAIEGIRDQIEALRELIAELREENSGSGGSGGGGGGRTTQYNGQTKSVDGMPYILQGPDTVGGTHDGIAEIDVAKPFGSDEHAIVSGTITRVGSGGDRGDYVVIAGDNGVDILYGHLAEGTAKAYENKINQRVERGDVIAQTGNTGVVGETPHSLNVFGKDTGENWHYNDGMARDDRADMLMHNIIDWWEQEYLIPFGHKIITTGDSISDNISKTSVIVRNANNEMDKASSEMANSLVESGVTTADGMARIIDLVGDGVLDFNGGITDIKNDLEGLGIPIDMTAKSLGDFINYIRSLQGQGKISAGTVDFDKFKIDKPWEKPSKDNPIGEYAFHDGGVVGETDKNTFSGGLKSNEVFAKLLKGEVVANEVQIRRFLNDTMPTIARGAVEYNRLNSTQPISINMPINVEGNLDESVLPDLEFKIKSVLGEVMRQITQQGYIRPVNRTIS